MAVKTDTETMNKINHLMAACRDREEGYRVARDGVNNIELKRLFAIYVEQSVQFQRELEQVGRQHGGETRQTGSIAGAAFHGWMNIKSAITQGDEAAILAECERGEDAAVHAYRKALEEELPADVATVVARQATQTEEAHVRMRTLRDAAKTSPSV